MDTPTELRRLADLIESGAVPEPNCVDLAFHVGDAAAATCRALAPAQAWDARPDCSGPVLAATLVPGAYDFSPRVVARVFGPRTEDEPKRTSQGERLLAEVTR